MSSLSAVNKEEASLRCFHKHSSLLHYAHTPHPQPSLCYVALPGAAGDVYVSDPWCLASKQRLARAPVLDWLHVSPLGLLYICVTTEPQLANESQVLTVHRMLTHKPWSVLRTYYCGLASSFGDHSINLEIKERWRAVTSGHDY